MNVDPSSQEAFLAMLAAKSTTPICHAPPSVHCGDCRNLDYCKNRDIQREHAYAAPDVGAQERPRTSKRKAKRRMAAASRCRNRR